MTGRAGHASGHERDETASPSPSRRAVLSAASISLLLGACSGPQQPARTTASGSPQPFTIDGLLAATPFLVAHRGSGDTWTEHTMDAYQHAAAAGAMALEVSVHATRDGVLVCHHDGDLKRMTGVARGIADVTWEELTAIRNDARRWLGPAAALQPVPRFTDVLDRFADSHVLFVEDKTGVNPQRVLDAIGAHRGAADRIVWKQHAGAPNLAQAQRRGLRSWGYFTNDELDVFDRLQSRFDLLGLTFGSTDASFRRVVATGKPVIGWEIHRRADRERMAQLGVRGLMCSNYPYVAGVGERAATDAFASGLRAVGDLPNEVGGDWALQPQLLPQESACRMGQRPITSYMMGSLSLADRQVYSIGWQMRWPTEMPADRDHAGIAFAQDTDAPYRPLLVSTASGYHVIVRANGEIALYRRAAGAAAGTLLAAFRSPAPKPGEWVSLTVDVTRTTVVVRRDGDDSWAAGAADDTYRGPYLSLCKNYSRAIPIDFRGIRLA